MSSNSKFSPYKRTYQFIHLQNSAYHLKNKKEAKSIVKTNIKSSRLSCSGKIDNSTNSKSELKPSDRYSQSNSKMIGSGTQLNCQSYNLKNPYRVIHKNQIFQRARSARIDHQNKKMVEKLIDADCMIVSRSRANKSYQRHRQYSNLIRKYQQNGQRHITPVINLSKISPTIAEYQTARIQSARQPIIKTQQGQLFPSNWMG